MDFIKFSETAHVGTWHEIIAVFPTAALALADTGPGTIAEERKDVPRSIPGARVGWFVNIADAHAVSAAPPAPTSAAVQESEIRGILHGSARGFNPALFEAAPLQRVRWYLRMCLAYLDACTTDAHFDAVKTAARADLAELAGYADTAWDALNTTAGLFEWSRAQAAALPAATAAAPARTLTQIQAVNVAQELG